MLPCYIICPPRTQGLQPRCGVGQKLVSSVPWVSLFNQSSVSLGTVSLDRPVTPHSQSQGHLNIWADGEMIGRHQQQGLQSKETTRKGSPGALTYPQTF